MAGTTRLPPTERTARKTSIVPQGPTSHATTGRKTEGRPFVDAIEGLACRTAMTGRDETTTVATSI